MYPGPPSPAEPPLTETGMPASVAPLSPLLMLKGGVVLLKTIKRIHENKEQSEFYMLFGF